MKRIISVMLVLSMICGCKKDKSGDVKYEISFTNSSNKNLENKGAKEKNEKADADSLYIQYGDYITSVTPAKFVCRFNRLTFHAETAIEEGGYGLGLMGSVGGAESYADFSNNTTIDVTPQLCGQINSDGNFVDDAIDFILLQMDVDSFYQEIELPIEYTNVYLNQFDFDWFNSHCSVNSNKIGNILKVSDVPLYNKMFNLDSTGLVHSFYFGRTDTTQLIFNPQHIIIQELTPIWNSPCFLVWSDHFNAWTLTPPKSGETKTIRTTIGFNLENMLQIYAGTDNIPYTSDDIIVYAPNFWERIVVTVTTDE